MSKPIKKREPFRIPTIDEVRAFINLCKPDWPVNFVNYLSDRWMDHYMANGFIVGRVKMQDWKSCVRGQWLQLKYKEDKERLETEMKSWQHKCLLDEKRRKSAGLFAVVEGSGPTPLERYLDSLDEVFAAYRVGNASDGQLRSIADWLERNHFQGVTPAQADRIAIESSNDGTFRRVETARQFFANLQKKGMTVRAYYQSKIAPSGAAKTA